jgi:hypothetical protein
MAHENDFAAVRRRLYELHAAGDYATALEVARGAAREFPHEAERATYWIACLLARLGDGERALEALEEGSRRGLWWAPQALEVDPDLESLRASDRFRAIVEAGRLAHASAGARPPTEPIVRRPVWGHARAALVVLHGRAQRAEEVVEQWGVAEHLVVAPHSTQAFGMRSGCWDDPQRAEADVRLAVDAALADDDGDLPLVIGGFSQGAALAVFLAAEGRLAGVRGCIAVAPSAGWMLELIGSEQSSLGGMRYLMLIGTLDPGQDDGRLLAEQVRALGGEVRIDVIEGLGHDYPTDFAQRLPTAVHWILTADVGAPSRHDQGPDPRA